MDIKFNSLEPFRSLSKRSKSLKNYSKHKYELLGKQFYGRVRRRNRVFGLSRIRVG